MARTVKFRDALLKEHRELRKEIAEVEDLARAAMVGALVPSLVPRTRALAMAIHDHNVEEERLLAPVLADVEALGRRLVNHLAVGHREQHAVIERALELAGSTELSSQDRARIVLSATRELLAHMEDEERQLMTESFLSEGYATDGFCG
jgi:hypothetical protein